MLKITLIKIIGVTLLVVGIFFDSPSVFSAQGSELIYSALPPAGESFYTAVMACGEIDGLPGEELIITDDFGAFQILNWDAKTKSFHQRWLNDPVFEMGGTGQIFITPAIRDRYAYIFFADAKKTLKIFKWLDYVLIEEKPIKLDSIENFKSMKDYSVGNFIPGKELWELAVLFKGDFSSKMFNMPFYSIECGYFNPQYKHTLSQVVLSNDNNARFAYLHGNQRSKQNLVLVSDQSPDKSELRITPLFTRTDDHNSITLEKRKDEKLGWMGRIVDDGDYFATVYRRSKDYGNVIRFLRLEKDLHHDFSIPLPVNVSSWLMGDLTGDGVRELVVLDSMGLLHIYNISNLIKRAKP